MAAFDRFLLPYTSQLDLEVARIVTEPLHIADQNPLSMGERAFEVLYSEMISRGREKTHCFLTPNLVETEVVKR